MGSKRIACSAENHSIEILNYSEGEKVPHSVVVVEGQVRAGGNSCQAGVVTVYRLRSTWCTPPTTTHSISASSQFKVILRLGEGVNTFFVKYCSVQKEFSIEYKPRNTPFCVLPLYVIFKGHDGRFQAPETEDNSIESACDRIEVGIRLVQSVFADKLKQGGYGRYTFQLQSDLNTKVPDVNVFYSNLTVQEAHSKATRDLWSTLAKELMASRIGKENHKFIAFLSSTIYKGQPITDGQPSHREIIRGTDGYVALGGGGLALLGTACLHTWATTIEEVQARLTNNEKVDTTMFMDDSNYRGTYGGCYASTLGASCHEMGHIFGLGHTGHGIMGRDYHNIQKVFLAGGKSSAHQSSKQTQMKTMPKPHNNPDSEIDLICERAPRSPKLVQECERAPTSPKLVEECERAPTSPKLVEECERAPTSPKLVQERERAPKSPKLVQELKVDWTVSEHKLPLRPKALGLRSLSCERVTENNLNSTQSEDPSPEKEAAVAYESPRPTYDCHDNTPFWPKSCLAFLAYNKWLNPNASEENTGGGGVTCDRTRRFSSAHGLRVVELRAENAKSILHWVFTESPVPQTFQVPEHYIYRDIKSLFAVDSVGNYLKLSVEPIIYPETISE